jgi:hypothetical protein
MDNIIDLIATDSSASDISDSIKNALFTKSAEKIEGLRPLVANSMFSSESEETQEDQE